MDKHQLKDLEAKNRVAQALSRNQADTQMNSKLQEVIAKSRSEYLSKVGTVIVFQMDMLLQTEHDKLSILVGLVCTIGARSEGKLEDLQKLIADNYPRQVELFKQAKAEAEAAQAAQPAAAPRVTPVPAPEPLIQLP